LNNYADDNSGMVYSVDNKTTGGFNITQKAIFVGAYPNVLRNGDGGNECCTEVSVSY
jgi:hypothetical protein